MPMTAPLSHHVDLYAYWLSKRGARAMPARGDVNPADIPLLLPHLILVERAGEQFRYRLVGSAIVRGVGYGITGGIVGSYIDTPEIGAEVRAIFEYAFIGASPIFATGRYIHKRGAGINLSLLTLPLSEDGRAVNMSISTLVARISAAPAPERGWLVGLHAKVSDVINVSNLTELRKLCLEWEQHGVPPSDGRLGKREG
jgi:hypothetical protein